jgi:hypothetical protein
VFIVVILSCKKQRDDSSQVNPTVQVNQTNNNIEARILSFKSDIESRLKSGSGYTINQAVWNIEALINYTYADVANNVERLSVDSVFLEVDLTNGKVSSAEAASVYDAIIDSLTIQYENLPSQNLHFMFADVFRRDSVATHVTFGVISAFVYGPLINYGEFDEDIDWWKYGLSWINLGGYCDGPYQGTHTNDDAAEQIERRIRLNISIPYGRHTPTDLVTLQIIGVGTVDCFENFESYACDFRNPNDPNPPDNYYDYFLMFQTSDYEETFHDCLSPDEMNFYWAGTQSICSDISSFCEEEYPGQCDQFAALLDGKDFMYIDIIGEPYYVDNYTDYQHRMLNTYGIWVANSNPPGTFN